MLQTPSERDDGVDQKTSKGHNLQSMVGAGGESEQFEGSVSSKTYGTYISAAGGLFAIIGVIIASLVAEGVRAFSYWWLAYWLEQGSGVSIYFWYIAQTTLKNYNSVLLYKVQESGVQKVHHSNTGLVEDSYDRFGHIDTLSLTDPPKIRSVLWYRPIRKKILCLNKLRIWIIRWIPTRSEDRGGRLRHYHRKKCSGSWGLISRIKMLPYNRGNASFSENVRLPKIACVILYVQLHKVS